MTPVIISDLHIFIGKESILSGTWVKKGKIYCIPDHQKRKKYLCAREAREPVDGLTFRGWDNIFEVEWKGDNFVAKPIYGEKGKRWTENMTGVMSEDGTILYWPETRLVRQKPGKNCRPAPG